LVGRKTRDLLLGQVKLSPREGHCCIAKTGAVLARRPDKKLPACNRLKDTIILGLNRSTSLELLLYSCIVAHQTRPPRSN
jgi:hypothetical protein